MGDKLNHKVSCALLLLLFLAATSVAMPVRKHKAPPPRAPALPFTWCVVNGSAGAINVARFIRNVCSKPGMDCSPIYSGGVCYDRYDRKNIKLAASYAINLNYIMYKQCPSGIGVITSKNPSTDNCKFRPLGFSST